MYTPITVSVVIAVAGVVGLIILSTIGAPARDACGITCSLDGSSVACHIITIARHTAGLLLSFGTEPVATAHGGDATLMQFQSPIMLGLKRREQMSVHGPTQIRLDHSLSPRAEVNRSAVAAMCIVMVVRLKYPNLARRCRC